MKRNLLHVKNKSGLLKAMMRVLTAENANISFEGKLSQTSLAKLKESNDRETAILKRATLWPKLDFLVMPLTQQTLPILERAISGVAFGKNGITHVQIEAHSQMAFAAYDNFHPNCLVAFPAVPASFLVELMQSNVLRSFKAANS